MAAKRRYPGDLTDRVGDGGAPAAPGEGEGTGRLSLEHSEREIVNAILYVTRSGRSWRMLPTDFPPWQTVYRYFAAWRDDGTVDVVHDALRAEVRTRSKKKAGGTRKVTPSAGIVDSQSLRGADTVGAETRGYDAGKKVQGRKRHIVTDTLGLRHVVMVTAASVQDCDGGSEIFKLATARSVAGPSLRRRRLRGKRPRPG